jgi:hypothetical protein
MPITRPANVHLPVGLLEIGDSFFIPALTGTAYAAKVHRLAAERDMKVECHMGIDRETGLYGMRVVRVA